MEYVIWRLYWTDRLKLVLGNSTMQFTSFLRDILGLNLESFKGELLPAFQMATLTVSFQKPACLKIPHCWPRIYALCTAVFMNHHVLRLENVPSSRLSHLKVYIFYESPGNINRLFFIGEKRILGEVGAEYLSNMSTNFALLCGNNFSRCKIIYLEW